MYNQATLTNEFMKNDMIKRLEAVEFTNNYIYAFSLNGVVYSYEAIGMQDVVLDRPSGKSYKSIRYRPTAAKMRELAKTARVLCTDEDLKAEILEYKEETGTKINKGDAIERILHKEMGLTYRKNSLSCVDGPDMIYNGKPVQIKYYHATYTDEATLENFENR